MRRASWVAAACMVSMALGPAVASAASAPIVIDSRAPALADGDGGVHTAVIGLTNLTTGAAALTVAGDAADRGCKIDLDPSRLPPAERADVTVTASAGCAVRADGIDFTVTARGGGRTLRAIPVTAAPAPAAAPDWDMLLAFPIALGGLLLGALLLYCAWGWKSHSPGERLTQLGATWSFSESWATNVTAVGGILTGVIGSTDVMTAIFGADAGDVAALAVVGAAVAVAFAIAGPVVLLATKTDNGRFITVAGLLLASAVTLAGAFGELWVVLQTGRDADLGTWGERFLAIAAAAAALLLLVYAIRTILAVLRLGTERPPAPPQSAQIASRLLTELAIDDVRAPALMERFAEELPTAGPPARRTALL